MARFQYVPRAHKTDEQIRAAIRAIYAERAAAGQHRPNREELGRLVGADKDRAGLLLGGLIEAGEVPELPQRGRGEDKGARSKPTPRGENRAPNKQLMRRREAKAVVPWHVRLRREVLACERRVGMGLQARG